MASRSQVSGSVSTTFGGVPRVCRGPAIACTATNGGTRTSTERPGACAARISASVRASSPAPARCSGTGSRSGSERLTVVAVHDQIEHAGAGEVERGDRAARAGEHRAVGHVRDGATGSRSAVDQLAGVLLRR